jgi:hypothetical protein
MPLLCSPFSRGRLCSAAGVMSARKSSALRCRKIISRGELAGRSTFSREYRQRGEGGTLRVRQAGQVRGRVGTEQIRSLGAARIGAEAAPKNVRPFMKSHLQKGCPTHRGVRPDDSRRRASSRDRSSLRELGDPPGRCADPAVGPIALRPILTDGLPLSGTKKSSIVSAATPIFQRATIYL